MNIDLAQQPQYAMKYFTPILNHTLLSLPTVPFGIEESSGIVTVLTPLHRHTLPLYDFEAVVTDGHTSLATNLTIHVVPVPQSTARRNVVVNFSVPVSVSVCVCVSVYPCVVCPCIFLIICSFVCLCVCISNCVFVFMCLSVSVCVPVCLHVWLSVCPLLLTGMCW